MARPLKLLLALGVILPLCGLCTYASGAAFSGALGAVVDRRDAELAAFAAGLAAAVAGFFLLPRPAWLYVLGHELTHWIFVRISGGRASLFEDVRVTSQGGYVRADRVNFLVVLAPYYFPIYTAWVFAVWWAVSLWVPLSGHVWALYALLGLTWGYHICFTVLMVPEDQPDFAREGWVFSVTSIYLVNLMLLTFFLVAANPAVSLGDWCDGFVEGARWLWRALRWAMRAGAALLS